MQIFVRKLMDWRKHFKAKTRRIKFIHFIYPYKIFRKSIFIKIYYNLENPYTRNLEFSKFY